MQKMTINFDFRR